MMGKYLKSVEIKAIVDHSGAYHHPGLYAGMETEGKGFVWAVDPVEAEKTDVDLYKHGETAPYKWHSGEKYRGSVTGKPFDGKDRRRHRVPCGDKNMIDADIERFWEAVDGLNEKGEKIYWRSWRVYEVGSAIGEPVREGWITKTL